MEWYTEHGCGRFICNHCGERVWIGQEYRHPSSCFEALWEAAHPVRAWVRRCVRASYRWFWRYYRL